MADALEGTKGRRLIKLVNLMHANYSTLSNHRTGLEQNIGFRSRIVKRLRKG